MAHWTSGSFGSPGFWLTRLSGLPCFRLTWLLVHLTSGSPGFWLTLLLVHLASSLPRFWQTFFFFTRLRAHLTSYPPGLWLTCIRRTWSLSHRACGLWGLPTPLASGTTHRQLTQPPAHVVYGKQGFRLIWLQTHPASGLPGFQLTSLPAHQASGTPKFVLTHLPISLFKDT